MFSEEDLEKDLVKGIRNKERKAYMSLYDRYYADLVFFASCYIKDKDSAKDIVQDVFIKLYEKSGEININQSLKAYLFQSVKNRCINFLRSLKVKDSHSVALMESHICANTLEYEDDSQLIRQMMDCIESLPSKKKEIILLRLTGKYKFREIAEMLGISENNAKVQIHNAILHLKKILLKKF